MKKILIPILMTVCFLALTQGTVLAAVIKSSGDLELVLENEPLFGSGLIWAPGMTRSAGFTVRNHGEDGKQVLVKAINAAETGLFASRLYLSFYEGGRVLYGAGETKTLRNFWDDGEVSLSRIPADGEKDYVVVIKMDLQAGNEFQQKQARFDLQIGLAGSPESVDILGVEAEAGGRLGGGITSQSGEVKGQETEQKTSLFFFLTVVVFLILSSVVVARILKMRANGGNFFI